MCQMTTGIFERLRVAVIRKRERIRDECRVNECRQQQHRRRAMEARKPSRLMENQRGKLNFGRDLIVTGTEHVLAAPPISEPFTMVIR